MQHVQRALRAGDIVRVSDGEPLSLEELLGELSSAQVVLLGEKHDNPEHHAYQAKIISGLGVTGVAGAAVFEMIDADKQAALNGEFAASSAQEVARRVDWADSGWPDFSMYAPVFEALLEQDASIVAAGLPKAELMPLARGGQPGAVGPFLQGWSERYGLEHPPSVEAAAELASIMQEAHCGLLPPGMVAPMVRIQRLRDAMLAEGLRLALSGGAQRAFLIAGAGHVRKDLGVPTLLGPADTIAVRVVGMVEEAEEPRSVGQYLEEEGTRFDYLVLTGRTPEADHCAELRTHFKGKRAQGVGAQPRSAPTAP